MLSRVIYSAACVALQGGGCYGGDALACYSENSEIKQIDVRRRVCAGR